MRKITTIPYTDILAPGAGFDGIVMPVNCRGTFGKGIRKRFKRRFPAAAAEIDAWARDDMVDIGHVMNLYAFWELAHAGIWYPFFLPTKMHWREPSRLEWIEEGLDNLTEQLDPTSSWRIKRLAIPALGCDEVVAVEPEPERRRDLLC